MQLTVTDTAAEKLVGIVAEKPDPGLGVRLFAQAGEGGGCGCSSGLRFGMAFDNEQSGDTRVSAGTLEFLVDPASAEALEGASIDWVDNVMNSGFAITAPNAPKAEGAQAGGGCGCGANEAHGAPQAQAQAQAGGGCGCGSGGGGCGCGGH